MLTNLVIQPFEGRESDLLPLLKLAVPAPNIARQILGQAKLYAALQGDQLIGMYALDYLDVQTVEVKALAVHESKQNQQVGTQMLEHAEQEARQQGYQRICIGTANSSLGQMALYQKLGYDLQSLKRNFFLKHYSEPLQENGIPVRHLLLFCKDL